MLGVELEPDLVELGTRHLDALDLPWASIHEAVPGVLGLPSAAPYHRILVSAMADELPDELVDQLHTGGVMVIPVAGTMLRVAASMRGRQVTRHGVLPVRAPAVTGARFSPRPTARRRAARPCRSSRRRSPAPAGARSSCAVRRHEHLEVALVEHLGLVQLGVGRGRRVAPQPGIRSVQRPGRRQGRQDVRRVGAVDQEVRRRRLGVDPLDRPPRSGVPSGAGRRSRR